LKGIFQGEIGLKKYFVEIHANADLEGVMIPKGTSFSFVNGESIPCLFQATQYLAVSIDG